MGKFWGREGEGMEIICIFAVGIMNDDKILAPAREVLIKFLKERKMRLTQERFAILEKVFSTDAHFYVDALHEALAIEGYRVSLSTVYSTIQLLAEAGLVRRHQFGSQPAQYERLIQGSRNNDHHHLVCNCCGRVRPIKSPELMAQIRSLHFPTFKSEYFSLYIYGICSRCQRMNKKQAGTLPPDNQS